MNDDSDDEEFTEADDLRRSIAELEREHRELDERVAEMVERAFFDQLEVARLKKRKLRIKDSIAKLKNQLIPDLDA